MDETALLKRILVYGILASLLTLGHQIWQLVVYYDTLEELNRNKADIYIDAIPTYIPFFLFILGLCCQGFCRSGDEDWGACDMLSVSTIWAMFYTMITHCIQVIVVMVKSMKSYLDIIPDYASCFCFPNTASVPGISLSPYTCTCRVPYEEDPLTLGISDPALLSKEVLEYYGYEPGDEIQVFNGTALDDAENYPGFQTFASTQLMMLLVQISLIIYVLRCPLWIMMRKYYISIKIKQLRESVSVENPSNGQETDDNDTESSSTHRWKRAINWSRHQVQKKKQLSALKKSQLGSTDAFIALTYYGFTEGLDAFSLLEEMFENADYFKADHHLTNSVLAFISINLLVVFVSDALTLVPVGSDDEETQNKFALGVKFIVVIISNLPFLILRIYLFWLFELTAVSLNTIFLLFIMKEVIVIVLGIAEVISNIQKREAESNGTNKAGVVC